jgi:cytosine deaminase
VRTYLGVDNVHDLFMPMVDGDIWTECRMLMETCRFYDIDAVAEWACQKPIQAKLEPKAKPEAVARIGAAASAGDKEPPRKRVAGGRRGR